MMVSLAVAILRAPSVEPTFGLVGIFTEESEFVVERAHYAAALFALRLALVVGNRAALHDALFGEQARTVVDGCAPLPSHLLLCLRRLRRSCGSVRGL